MSYSAAPFPKGFIPAVEGDKESLHTLQRLDVFRKVRDEIKIRLKGNNTMQKEKIKKIV
ncbi:hypothetical protein JCM16816_12840 [Thermoanaerobacter brockii subsp. lactiethylicus]|jgi:hypothetical protein|nr:hypothetical protein [Thermoanaerobacter sp.]MDI3501512.1 hypothetical protein [Thermoanaerobacter sp.]